MRALARAASLSLVLAAAATGAGCGDDDDGGTTPDAANNGVDAGADAAPNTGPHTWSAIIEADWTVPAGAEKYFCASKTLTEDVYIGGFRPIDPLGTHHTAFTYGPPTTPDNPGYDCSAGSENPQWIYASGVGTNELMLPEGVGVKIPAGQQVHVNLHLFNVSEQPLTGTSGVEIFGLAAAEVVNEAEMFLPGAVQFTIPAGMEYTKTSDCTISAPQTLVALFPHMHQLGTHFKTELVRADASVVTLHDDAYQFESQEFKLLTGITAAPGDKIRTSCTWNNTTGEPVPWGDSSTEEMCFSIMIRYPRMGAGGPTGVLCPR